MRFDQGTSEGKLGYREADAAGKLSAGSQSQTDRNLHTRSDVIVSPQCQ